MWASQGGVDIQVKTQVTTKKAENGCVGSNRSVHRPLEELNPAFLENCPCLGKYNKAFGADLPVGVQESPAEAWVGGGLLQGGGDSVQHCMPGTF